MGLVNVPLHPAAARLVGNWVTPSGRNLVNGLVTCAAPLGISVTYLLFGWLIDTFDWTGASLCASGGTLLLASIWTFAASDKPKGSTTPKTENQATAAGSCKLLLQHRSLIFLTLSYALVSYFQYLFFYWAQFYFEKVRNLPKDTSRLYSTMLSLAMGFGMVMGGWLSDAFRARSMNRRTWTIVPVASLLFAAVAVVPGILSEETWITLACFSIAMFAVGASEGSFWTLAVELGGKRGGTAAGILNTGGNAGGLIAPVITPYISALFGWQAGLGLASVVCILGALCWVGIDPNECMADSTEPQIEDC